MRVGARIMQLDPSDEESDQALAPRLKTRDCPLHFLFPCLSPVSKKRFYLPAAGAAVHPHSTSLAITLGSSAFSRHPSNVQGDWNHKSLSTLATLTRTPSLLHSLWPMNKRRTFRTEPAISLRVLFFQTETSYSATRGCILTPPQSRYRETHSPKIRVLSTPPNGRASCGGLILRFDARRRHASD